MSAIPGLVAFFVGVALLCAPWWSSTLPASDYPLVIALGTVFAAIGVFAALPESWQRLRALSFALFMGTFGAAALGLWGVARESFGRRSDGGGDPPP